MTDDRTYTLKYPVQFQQANGGGDGRSITTVALRRPTGRDLLLIDQYKDQPMRLTIEMIAQLANLTPAEVKMFDAEDIGPLGDLAMPGMVNGPQTGATA